MSEVDGVLLAEQKESARELGEGLGFDFAQENWSEVVDEGDALEDRAVGMAFAVFEHYSQFSPWEFTAAEFNKSEDPDAVWAAFEDGLEAGAKRYARENA